MRPLVLVLLLSALASAEPICPRAKIAPHLSFPFFRATLRVNETVHCRFQAPKGFKGKTELVWGCMTNGLFDGPGKKDPRNAVLTLKSLEVPTVLYKFRNNWCTCTIRLTDDKGKSCSRKEVQYFQLLPRPAKDAPPLSISLSSAQMPWLKEQIWTRGCQSVQLCRDGQFQPDTDLVKEDTHMLPRGADDDFNVLKKALRPHPRILFKTSYRYPFAVLDLCQLRAVYGSFDYFCQHRDGRKGKEQKMKISIDWSPKPEPTTAAAAKAKDDDDDEDDDEDEEEEKTLKAVPTVTMAAKKQQKAAAKKPQPRRIHPRVRHFLQGLSERLRTEMHRQKEWPPKSARRQRPELPEIRRLARMTARLERKERQLRLALFGVKIAVTGCVLLLIASFMWYYAGLSMMRKAKVPSPAAL